MATFINENEDSVRDEFLELFAYKRRRDGVLLTPHEQNGYFDEVEFIGKVVADGRFGSGDNPDRFVAVVDGREDVINKLLRSDCGVVESTFCFFLDKLIIVSRGEAGTHTVFK